MVKVQFSDAKSSSLNTMMFLSGLVGLLLVLTAEASVGNSSGLDFCSATPQCLLFSEICEADDYTVRHYGPVKYVATNLTGSSMMSAIHQSLQKLNEYMNGTNDMGVTLEYVTPVLINSFQNGVYKVMLVLPAEHQAAPPTPTDDALYIDEWPHLFAYVLAFDDLLTDTSDAEALSALKEELDAVGANYVQDFHITAVYKGPAHGGESYSEVALLAQGEPVCGMTD